MNLEHYRKAKTGVICNVDSDMCEFLLELVRKINYQQTDKNQDNNALSELFDLREHVPAMLRSHIQDFKNSHISYMRINGLPKDKYPEILLMMAGLIGLPFCHSQEASLVSVVKPKKEAKVEEISYYTWNRFVLHSELPYVKNPPDFLMLYCKHNVPGGSTHSSSVDAAVALLDKHDIELLSKPNFQIVIPPHFNHSEPYAPSRPIIEKAGAHYRIRIRFDDIRYLDEESRGAVKRLYQALDEVKEEHLLANGDMLIINNNAALHGRSSFTPRFDQKDRELYRVYVYSDCSKILNKFDYSNKRISGF